MTLFQTLNSSGITFELADIDERYHIENEGKLRNQAKDSLKYLCTVACD